MSKVPLTSPAEPAPPPRQWLSLLVLGLGLAIVIIDGTIVNVILPAISREFGATLRDLQWVNAIYSLVYAALIVTFGRIGDQLGRKLLFVAGVFTFVAGSALSGAASSIGMLVAARAVQGLGAAMTSPSTLSIISSTFTGRSRGVAFGVWGAIAGAAAALGPLLGGWLTTVASWRWAFYVNLPIGVIAVAGALLVIKESRAESRRVDVDGWGILLISVSVGALVLGLIEGQTYGWVRPRGGFAIGAWAWPFTAFSVSAAAFVIAVLGTTAFVLRERGVERRGREPLFDLGLLKYRGFRYGLITVSIVALGEFGVIFVLSLYLQGVLGYTALQTGLTFLPFAALTLVVAPSAGILAGRFGPKWVVTAGMLIEAVFILLLSRTLAAGTSRLTIILLLLGYGVGVGLAIAQLTNIVLSEVPSRKLGAGSGANNTLRQIGSALGIAVIGAVLSASLSVSAQERLRLSTDVPDTVKTAIIASLDKGATLGEGAVTVTGAPAGVQKTAAYARVALIIKESFVDAARTAGLVAGLFVLLGAVSSLFIPGRMRREKAVPKARVTSRYRTIIVPLDGSAAAESVISHVQRMAGDGAEVVLLRIVAKPNFDLTVSEPQLSACLDDELTAETRDYLEGVAARLRGRRVTVSCCVLAEQGPVGALIVEFARRSKADLVVVSAHGTPGLLGGFFGSVAEKIVHGAGVPVLVVHP
jgi:EmrB/QacA subfamily drug resistance transporter